MGITLIWEEIIQHSSHTNELNESNEDLLDILFTRIDVTATIRRLTFEKSNILLNNCFK